MDVINRTLHKILYTKHSRSGGKINKEIEREEEILWQLHMDGINLYDKEGKQITVKNYRRR